MRRTCPLLLSRLRPFRALLPLVALLVGAGLMVQLGSGGCPPLEAASGLAPLEDHDGDGIPNVADSAYHGCDPGLADTDGDGHRDGYELATGSDPFDYYSRPAEVSGVRILVAPEGDSVYVVFLMASGSGFVRAGGQRIFFVQHNEQGPIAVATLDATSGFLERVHRTECLSGQVKSWTVTIPRSEVGLWSLGFGMYDDGWPYCDGIVVHRRLNDCIYTLRFPSGIVGTSRLEATESEIRAGAQPGQGFKECEQVSCSRAGSPLRYIQSENCETREHYTCPPDCGALAGHAIVDLNQIWLY
ncbi:MAG: hypothetical protein JXQ29_06180 [Planctomycetes bacterium]|nr:hypothetical protein [Planctomycetota bacterium]